MTSQGIVRDFFSISILTALSSPGLPKFKALELQASPFWTLLTRNCPKVLNVKQRDDKTVLTKSFFLRFTGEKSFKSFTAILRKQIKCGKKLIFI